MRLAGLLLVPAAVSAIAGPSFTRSCEPCPFGPDTPTADFVHLQWSGGSSSGYNYRDLPGTVWESMLSVSDHMVWGTRFGSGGRFRLWYTPYRTGGDDDYNWYEDGDDWYDEQQHSATLLDNCINFSDANTENMRFIRIDTLLSDDWPGTMFLTSAARADYARCEAAYRAGAPVTPSPTLSPATGSGQPVEQPADDNEELASDDDPVRPGGDGGSLVGQKAGSKNNISRNSSDSGNGYKSKSTASQDSGSKAGKKAVGLAAVVAAAASTSTPITVVIATGVVVVAAAAMAATHRVARSRCNLSAGRDPTETTRLTAEEEDPAEPLPLA